MRKLFSLRHELGLRKKTLSLSISRPTRIRLRDVVRGLNYDYEPRYGDYTTVTGEALAHLKTCLGLEEILVYGAGGQRVPADGLDEVIMSGWPSHALDAVEAFYDKLGDSQQPAYCAQVNDAFVVSDAPFRILDGYVWKIDSAWLADDVVAAACDALKDTGFDGPLEEFQNALTALQNGETKEAITLANHALESTMKAILGVEREKPGKLLRHLIDSGLVEDYCEGFVSCFEPLVAAVSAIRHDAPGAGHGQGAQEKEIPRRAARLMVHLTGALIVFLVECHTERASADPFQDS